MTTKLAEQNKVYVCSLLGRDLILQCRFSGRFFLTLVCYLSVLNCLLSASLVIIQTTTNKMCLAYPLANRDELLNHFQS
jgi:hypothetical protein